MWTEERGDGESLDVIINKMTSRAGIVGKTRK